MGGWWGLAVGEIGDWWGRGRELFSGKKCKFDRVVVRA